MSRLPRTTRGARSFGHENSAPLVAQNHPPSIDPYSVAAEAAEKERGREERAISRHENHGMADRYVNNLIFAREKKKREEGKEWREESTETLLGLMKRVLIRDTFLGG